MEMQLSESAGRFRSPQESLGDLDAGTAAGLMAASNDVALVLDRDGIIRDVSVSGAEPENEAFADVLGRHWVDVVANDSRLKVEEMLRDAQAGRKARWREINHQSPRGNVPFRYLALKAGHDGKTIALGRDLRSVAALQQRLLQAQQSMERDYVRLRQAEARYRLLFHISSEAVLIVDAATKKVVESNPAAAALIGISHEALQGQAFARLIHPDYRDSAAALLIDSGNAGRSEPLKLRLPDGRDDYAASASVFRQDGVAHVLVRLVPVRSEPSGEGDSRATLLRVLNRIPDAFVITDESLNIIDANLAFLELSQLPSTEAARGQSLARFVGRPGIDLNVLQSNLREHGWVRNFNSIVRTLYGAEDEVDISAVSVREGLEGFHGFVLRSTRRRPSASPTTARELPRSGEQLTELVGRVSLREIVRETTDVIERMCIESALKLTGNNRASAAEMLGLSRQSLYSKLNRYDLVNAEADDSEPD